MSKKKKWEGRNSPAKSLYKQIQNALIWSTWWVNHSHLKKIIKNNNCTNMWRARQSRKMWNVITSPQNVERSEHDWTVFLGGHVLFFPFCSYLYDHVQFLPFLSILLQSKDSFCKPHGNHKGKICNRQTKRKARNLNTLLEWIS